MNTQVASLWHHSYLFSPESDNFSSNVKYSPDIAVLHMSFLTRIHDQHSNYVRFHLLHLQKDGLVNSKTRTHGSPMRTSRTLSNTFKAPAPADQFNLLTNVVDEALYNLSFGDYPDI